ncbi:MAG: lipid A export permease/ATP-binding protein MsbA [Psychrobium sp.]
MSSTPTFDSKVVAKRLTSYFLEYKSALLLAMLALLVYAGVDASLIYYSRELVDRGITGNDSSFLQLGAIFVIGVFVVRGIASFISTYLLAWVGSNIIMKMRQQLFRKMLNLPVSYFDNNSSGSLISKITFDTEQVSRATTQVIIVLIREGATIAYLLAIMFYYSWQLSLIFFLVGPLIGAVIATVSKRFRRISKNIQGAMGKVTSSSEQMLKAHKVILAFSGQEKETARFDKVNNSNRQQSMKLVAASASSTPIIQLIGSMAIAGVLFGLSLDGVIESLTAGAFVALVTAMGSLMRPLKQISKVNVELQRGLTACASVFELLDKDDAVNHGDKVVERANGKLSIEGLNFAYDGADGSALKNIDLEIASGATVALVGRSGSGKSTLASLLTRFYESDNDAIKLDGVSINDIDVDSLRKQFALVTQQVVLFDDSIYNNIAYGATAEVTIEQVTAAAKAANVTEFTDKMPEGLQSPVGEDGANLSGGQRQRIAIARAILRNAPMLILDEATSALDTESERLIQNALENLQQDRTSIIVAHRLSTIENADMIVVMDNGAIIERGTHQELLAQQGAYYQLHAMQQSQG